MNYLILCIIGIVLLGTVLYLGCLAGLILNKLIRFIAKVVTRDRDLP